MADKGAEESRRSVAGRAERSDSIRNRQKLTAAAQAVFAAEGLNAPMDRIAAAAGVGPGTLYRHFPSRLKLWEAVLEEPLRGQLVVARDALANPDRWDGLAGYIVASCEIEAERDGYLNLMNTRFDGAPELQAIRAEIQRTVKKLVTLAREEGVVRPDFTMEDLLFIAVSNSRIAEVTRSTAPGAWRRNVELFLDAIRPERAHPLSQRPLTPSQVARSMVRPEPSQVRSARNDRSRE